MEIIEALKELDQDIFLYLNQFNNDFFDIVMYWVTNKWTWMPLYLLLLIFLGIQFRKRAILITVLFITTIIVNDQFTSSFMKPYFGRLRPCHDPEIISQVHIVEKCGGRYGFASGHSSNSFAIATFLWLFLRFMLPYSKWLFAWAFLIAYSRIYLGVHYPLDIIVGALVGTTFALIFFGIYRFLEKRIWG